MQRLLNFSSWDQDACRDAACRYVVRQFGDPGGVRAVDETGFLKKGRMSPGTVPAIGNDAIGRAEKGT
jgi:DDE superfamily endonuclease